MIQITMVDLERLVCRMTRYKQESAKYRKIVAVVLILLAVLAAVWLAERWYTRHKTSAAAAGVNPIGQLLTGQPDPAVPYTGTISLVVAGYDRSAEDGEEEIGLTDMILYLQWGGAPARRKQARGKKTPQTPPARAAQRGVSMP